ncbi:T9SS type A sorting domain-containing protein [Hymenobacter pini]|uniref:T9SS type A sorting domain-containing protein n=1 Tax=Hymenobacter pini TaxID=2880879 RepID=UPI001CF435E8|nr:T9SS type A sorting domain-containing protein [Hymenobacter pini]MCA8832684.1 PIG-L family deacetylase [Hymenobacter pini]
MRKLLFWIFLTGVLCQLPGFARAQSTAGGTTPSSQTKNTPKWTAVLTAHPDDWQLFMGSAICEELKNTRRKVVFICLSGGQADMPSDSYWQGRESGHRASVQQAGDLLSPITATSVSEKVTVNGHAIDTYRSRNSVAFYLHLPDGGAGGKGFARGGFQSLKQLYDRNLQLKPLDGAAPYTSWEDLKKTILGLLAHEAILGQLTMHIPSTDTRCNPGDHSDHYMAGLLAQQAIGQLECRFFQYVGYNISKRPVNLTEAQIANQRQVYRAYCQTMVAQGQEDPWDAKHLAFVGHQYMQVKHQAGPQLQPTAPVASQPATPDMDDDQLLDAYVVFQPPHPNPLSVSSQLVFSLPIPSAVWLRVLDSQGREIMNLLQGDRQSAGQHEQWLDVQRFPASGMYIAELRVGKHLWRQRVIVAR